MRGLWQPPRAGVAASRPPRSSLRPGDKPLARPPGLAPAASLHVRSVSVFRSSLEAGLLTDFTSRKPGQLSRGSSPGLTAHTSASHSGAPCHNAVHIIPRSVGGQWSPSHQPRVPVVTIIPLWSVNVSCASPPRSHSTEQPGQAGPVCQCINL